MSFHKSHGPYGSGSTALAVIILSFLPRPYSLCNLPRRDAEIPNGAGLSSWRQARHRRESYGVACLGGVKLHRRRGNKVEREGGLDGRRWWSGGKAQGGPCNRHTSQAEEQPESLNSVSCRVRKRMLRWARGGLASRDRIALSPISGMGEFLGDGTGWGTKGRRRDSPRGVLWDQNGASP